MEKDMGGWGTTDSASGFLMVICVHAWSCRFLGLGSAAREAPKGKEPLLPAQWAMRYSMRRGKGI